MPKDIPFIAAASLLICLPKPNTRKTPHIAGHKLHVSSSIGIGVNSDDGLYADSAMHNADTAMGVTKACKRNNYPVFGADTNTPAVSLAAHANG